MLVRGRPADPREVNGVPVASGMGDHGAGRDDLRATGVEVSVHVDEPRGPSTPVPEAIVALFEGYEGRSLRG